MLLDWEGETQKNISWKPRKEDVLIKDVGCDQRCQKLLKAE